jgi:hypothetical protein
VNEDRLRSLLREAPVPGGEEAERRGLRVLESAFAERRPPRRAMLPRAALALATAGLLAILLLSPAGAAVRNWINDVFDEGVPNAEPALSRIPGGGRLAVSSAAGPWVVRPDGSRRLLGAYREASWSPHGLFLAAASGRTLTAVEPDGDPHWSVTAPGQVADPRWSPSGLRIAYRSGRALRVVHADGSTDAQVDGSVAPLAPAWSPAGLDLLAYLDRDGRVVVADADGGKPLASAAALPGIMALQWGPRGELLEASPAIARLRQIKLEKLSGDVRLGSAKPLPRPGSGRIAEALLSPRGDTVALVRRLGGLAQTRTEVDLVDSDTGSVRRLFRTPGHLGEIAWSPDAKRLLISWPQADQWLFVPTSGRGRLQALAGISQAFAPGSPVASGPGAFPRISGWCCSAASP